jgi:hypothetical protein
VDPRYRADFNAAYSAARFARYSAALERRLGCDVGFRLAETPVFVPRDFRVRVERAATEIVAQLCEPARIERMSAAVPERWRVPRRARLPTFAALDFATVRAADGTLVPRLVELQGFPSLLAFETMQGDAWSTELATVPGCEGPWTSRFLGRDRDALLAVARDTIVGSHEPQHVVLMDLDPREQKTYCDFAATKALFGVDAIGPEQLTKRGRRLFRRSAGGREIPVERIYNRMIVDEVERKGTSLPFDLRDDLDVEWTPHPDWFWIWSKYSLPLLDHPAVPRTVFLSDVREPPDDLAENYVLKPLFSFAGGGVNVKPTASDVAAIPAHARGAWCLQEKIAYGGVLAAPDGGDVKVEMRVMFLRPDETAEMSLALNLCRLARGEMLGVDYNRDLTYTGSSIGLWPEAEDQPAGEERDQSADDSRRDPDVAMERSA